MGEMSNGQMILLTQWGIQSLGYQQQKGDSDTLP
jgi:hypothetical protein